MGRFILPIFFYFFFSCSNSESREIALFDGHTYLLKDGEVEIEKNSQSLKEANELKEIFDKEELVLYKSISHKNYNTYLFIDLDSTIKKSNIYKKIDNNPYSLIFYQHMVDSLSEITSITMLNDNKHLERFSKDSLNKSRFVIKDLRND